jgi:hypothetical protein
MVNHIRTRVAKLRESGITRFGIIPHRESWRAHVRRISSPPIFLVLLPLAADKLSDEALDAVAGGGMWNRYSSAV